MVDYSEDQRIGKQMLATTTDAYRKLRNTLRYLLGALDGFSEAERVPVTEMEPLERYILHRMWEIDAEVRRSYEAYRFSDAWRAVMHFCSEDLSSLYFDIRKDSLYCDRADSLRRRGVRTVMDEAFHRLTVWLSPLAVFTTEEAWTTRFPDAGPNILRELPDQDPAWENEAEKGRWDRIKALLEAVNGAIEEKRTAKEIGSSLEALPHFLVDAETKHAFGVMKPEDVFRTSDATLDVDSTVIGDIRSCKPVSVSRAPGHKCERCWKVLPEVAPPKMLCERCDDAVTHIDAGT
jgi:isoleucyl-tRNA synthetase